MVMAQCIARRKSEPRGIPHRNKFTRFTISIVVNTFQLIDAMGISRAITHVILVNKYSLSKSESVYLEDRSNHFVFFRISASVAAIAVVVAITSMIFFFFFFKFLKQTKW